MKTLLLTTKQTVMTALVLAGLTLTASRTQAADLHYLSVGVSVTPKLSNNKGVDFASKDAKDLAAVLAGQQGKHYTAVHGEVLVDSNATQAKILAGLDRIIERAKKGDTVCVTVAGHGDIDPGRNGGGYFFVTHDFDPFADVSETALTEGMLRDRLTQLTRRGVAVLLVLDTCRSGSFSSGDSGIIVLAACQATGFSQEAGTIGNGLYTRALIEGIQGKADANGDNVITLAELDAYIARRVPELYSQAFTVGTSQAPGVNRPAGIDSQIALFNAPVATPVTTDRPTTTDRR